MSQASNFINSFCKQVSKEEAPNLFNAVEDLVQKANHPNAVFHEIHFIKDDICKENAMLDNLAGCIKDGEKNILVFGKGIRNLFGHSSANSEVSQELKSIIAHELGHARYADTCPLGRIKMSLASPLAGMMIGLGGVAIAKSVMANNPNDKEKQLEELEKHKETVKDSNGSVKFIANMAIYTAGAALGLYAGTHVGKLMRHGMEYRADEYSAELMGSGEPMAKALSTIEKHFDKLEEGIAENSILMKIKDFLHPPINERINKMKSFATER